MSLMSTFLHTSKQKKGKVDRQTAGTGYQGKACFEEGHNNGYSKAYDASSYVAAGLYHGGEDHEGKCHIGHIVEERSYEAALDLPVKEDQGNDSYKISYYCHNKDVDVDVSHTSSTGHTSEARAEIATVRMMMAEPLLMYVLIKSKEKI